METVPPLIGEDPAFLDVIEHVSRVAPVDRPCLVVGERGTGKELITSRLHYLSRRWDGPLVKVNCATLAESLLESELFGHEAGAFTGAQRRHPGRFERADGGTLVLDEIASASAAVQEKVLRIIEYGEFERVGGTDTLRVNVRVVGSANVDLPTLAERGEFRSDLLDRLAFDVMTLPPLRSRPADIMPLAIHFGTEMAREMGREVFRGFARAAQKALHGHAWPGNVRELRNVVERAVSHHSAPGTPVAAIELDPFDSPWRPVPSGASRTVTPSANGDDRDSGFTERVARFESALLTSALREARFNQTVAARSLGLGYHQFRRLAKKHGLAASGGGAGP